MNDSFNLMFENIWNNISSYFAELQEYPIKLITLIIDLILVGFLIYKVLKIVKATRAWQLLKGIALLLIITALSGILKLRILNFILTSCMTYIALILIVVFQPELRRTLEQLGTSRFRKFFGIEKDIVSRTKEDIYKVVIAVEELSKAKTGALIVFERDIELRDIIDSGIPMGSEISPQLIVNIFTPNTPLHDGAIIISNNRIISAACMLPLASDKDIAKELGTRHRAAIGISKESDAIAIIVSEETGKVSIAKDGTLIADVNEESLKKILLKHIVSKRFETKSANSMQKIKSKLKNKINKKTKRV